MSLPPDWNARVREEATQRILAARFGSPSVNQDLGRPSPDAGVSPPRHGTDRDADVTRMRDIARKRESSRRREKSQSTSAFMNSDLVRASPRGISSHFSDVNQDLQRPVADPERRGAEWWGDQFLASPETRRPLSVNEVVGKKAPTPIGQDHFLGVEAMSRIAAEADDKFRSNGLLIGADHADRANLEEEVHEVSLQLANSERAKLALEFNHFHLHEALNAEIRRTRELTVANENLLAQKESELALRDNQHDVEKTQLRQQNSALTYDINCLAAKNGRLEKSIEQLHNSSIVSLTEKDLVGLDLRVVSDNEMVSDLFELDSLIQTWSDECVSLWKDINEPVDEPRCLEFLTGPVWYTLIESSAHYSPLLRSRIWGDLNKAVFNNWTSSGTATKNPVWLDPHRFETERDLQSFRNLWKSFYNSKLVRSNSHALDYWQRLTVSFFTANSTKSDHLTNGEGPTNPVKQITQIIKLSCADVLAHMDRWRDSDNTNLEHIVRKAMSYYLKMHLHSNSLHLVTGVRLAGGQKNERPATQRGNPRSKFTTVGAINATICPGLYADRSPLGPLGLAEEPKVTAIEEAQILQIPILIHPDRKER